MASFSSSMHLLLTKSDLCKTKSISNKLNLKKALNLPHSGIPPQGLLTHWDANHNCVLLSLSWHGTAYILWFLPNSKGRQTF